MRSFGDAASQATAFGGRVLGRRGAAATEHHLSALTAMEVLADGGNAFDAAAAAVLVEGLVNPHMFTLGGECPALLKPAPGERVVAVNGNVAAPAGATLAAFTDRGLSRIPPRGVIASGAPAAMDALLTMLEAFGGLPFEELCAPARDLARDGFPVHAGLRDMPVYGLTDNVSRFRDAWPASAALYLAGDGRPPETGDLLRNPDLADLLDALMDAARAAKDRLAGYAAVRDLFYRGEPAALMAAHCRERDGLVTREDLAVRRAQLEEPVSLAFRGALVHKCGPWSQGPVFLQILSLLDGYDLASLGHNSAEYLHLWIEAAKLAFADREQYYGDPDQTDVPLAGLLSADYAAARRALIDPGRAERAWRPGDPRRGAALLAPGDVLWPEPWSPGTVHVAVADRWGALAALTPSGGWITGNEVVAGLGFPLTTRLQTFRLRPGHPNAPAPGKRPRTTLSPSLAVFGGAAGEPAWDMAFGTMGGDQQDQWISQFFLNRLVFGMTVQEAIEAPKITTDHFPGSFHPHDAAPGRIKVENRLEAAVIGELERRGHEVAVEGGWSAGFVCAVSRRADGLLEAGADPRGNMARVFPACALAR